MMCGRFLWEAHRASSDRLYDNKPSSINGLVKTGRSTRRKVDTFSTEKQH
jgi:hypothetical protein